MPMEKTIQFIQVTPEQLQNAILEGVKGQLESIKEYFQPKEPIEYLSRREVAELLKVDISTIHNWTVKGKLTSYGIGGKVLYKRTEVEAAVIPLNQ